MSPSTQPRQSLSTANLVSGGIGGLIVLVLGAILIATGVIDTGKTERTVVRQPALANTSDAKSGSSDGTPRTVSDIYKREGRGVVFIEARGVSEDSIFGTGQQGDATGSGFLVDKNGTILTNAHVVEGSSDVTVRLSQDGPQIKADVKGRDPSSDLAVLKVKPSDVSGVAPVPLGNSDTAQVGDPVVAIGNPFGFARTVTTGIVSAKARQITAPNGFPIRNVLQTDASINPGNSGGPLMDATGKVVGINSQIATGGGQGSVGIAFAIPINTAKQLLPRLEKGGQIQRAYLGVEMAPVTAQVAKELKLPVSSGALIQSVVPNGPAKKAGLHGGSGAQSGGISRGGDVIVTVAGKQVKTPDDVANAIATKKPGDKVQVEYYRDNDKKTATVTLGKRPASLQNSSSQGNGGGGNGDGLIPLP
jgi:S1-C subfamily serine protease